VVTYDPTSSTHTNTAGSLIADWSAVFNNMLNMSLFVGAYDHQIPATKANQTVTFTGTDPEMNVFSVTGDQLTGTTGYNFAVPSGSGVIVNIFPTKNTSGGGFKSMSIANAGITGNVTPGNLLWNVTWTQPPTSLTISSVNWTGALLAPNSILSVNNSQVTGTVVGLRVLNSGTEYYSSPYHVPSLPLTLAKQYIKHVVVIMQENRSFDNYFSGYPGVDSNPLTGTRYQCNGCNCGTSTCTAGTAGCYSFREITNTVDPDVPHSNPDFVADSMAPITQGGKTVLSPISFLQHTCSAGFTSQNDLQAMLGFHNANEIPNYWTYAQSFLLQDMMFQPIPSFSAPSHTYLVSGWNADCNSGTCIPKVDNVYPVGTDKRYLWNDITNLLKGKASWKFYLGEDFKYNCGTACSTNPLSCFQTPGTDTVHPFWNPMNGTTGTFKTVSDNGDLGNVVQLKTLYEAIGNANDPLGNEVPQVSWIVPGIKVSEHAGLTNPPVDIKWGQAYVTSIINAIMSKPALWQTTAIFLSWDDWGGFYDHVVALSPFTNDSYGLRVPGMLISPWVKPGIDHQTLSHDAYLKLIEDLFLGGQRIGPGVGASTTKDARMTKREDAPILGDLVKEFDFNHTPVSGLNLPCSVP
jgi:phospholipase C